MNNNTALKTCMANFVTNFHGLGKSFWFAKSVNHRFYYRLRLLLVAKRLL